MTERIQSPLSLLRLRVEAARRAGRTIAFVPTMGYLHRGHQSLIETAHAENHFTVVSIFVNPTQFGPNEDFESYPRDSERDFQLSAEAGADIVWFPSVGDIYPHGSETRVEPGELAKRLCGLSRPQFFGGICTVVLKLFQIVTPDVAYFGEKDYQQLTIVKKMVEDFYLPVRVIGMPTLREADGLAMSSRNARLAPEERSTALALFRAIEGARSAFSTGERNASALIALLRESWPLEIDLDYLEFRDGRRLEPVQTLTEETRLFIGAWLNGIRLIDNAPLSGPL